jgi:hypothetical protein
MRSHPQTHPRRAGPGRRSVLGVSSARPRRECHSAANALCETILMAPFRVRMVAGGSSLAQVGVGAPRYVPRFFFVFSCRKPLPFTLERISAALAPAPSERRRVRFCTCKLCRPVKADRRIRRTPRSASRTSCQRARECPAHRDPQCRPLQPGGYVRMYSWAINGT